MTQQDNEVREIESDTAVVSLVSKAELDQSIATAHQWPRSITKFRREALDMATMDEQTASECIYSLPRRDGGETKMITGPSARLAEIIISAWGNVRAGARVIDEGREFVTAQGVFHDLEKNVGITYEVKRRITNRNGQRFSADMIAVTANAACSIALRNAVFKGVPKALWAGVESEVRKVIAGDAKTLGARREIVMSGLNKMGVPNEKIFAVLGVAGISDVGLDEIVTLKGLGNAIKEGEMSIEEAFSTKEVTVGNRTEAAKEALRSRMGVAQSPAAATEQTPSTKNSPLTQGELNAVHDKAVDAMSDIADKEIGQSPLPWEAQKDFTTAEWVAALRAVKTKQELQTVWGNAVDAHDAKTLTVPIDIEAVYHMVKEKFT